MRNRMARWMKTTATVSTGFVILGGGCVADNFWIDKSSEIINRAIFGVINAVLAAAGTGIAI